MSSRTTNIGLEKVTSDQTIGDLQESMNGSGGNMDIIDTKMGPVGNTSLQAQVNALNSNIIARVKCIRMDVELDAQGVWGAWNYNIGYTNYQLLKAFVFTWNNVTVIGANNGFWNIKVDGLASQTVNVCFVIASAPIPNS